MICIFEGAFIADTNSFYQLALQPTFQVNDTQLMALGWGIFNSALNSFTRPFVAPVLFLRQYIRQNS